MRDPTQNRPDPGADRHTRLDPREYIGLAQRISYESVVGLRDLAEAVDQNDGQAAATALQLLSKAVVAFISHGPVLEYAAFRHLRAASRGPVHSRGVSGTSFIQWTINLASRVVVRALIPLREADGSLAVDPVNVELLVERWPAIRKELRKLETLKASAILLECKWEAAHALKGLGHEPRLPFKTEGQCVTVDHVWVPLNLTPEKTEDALAFLNALLEAKGNWLSSTDIGKETKKEGTRFDLVFKVLPQAIKSCIESNRRKGYRISLRN
jgi:hypothetical protein